MKIASKYLNHQSEIQKSKNDKNITITIENQKCRNSGAKESEIQKNYIN